MDPDNRLEAIERRLEDKLRDAEGRIAQRLEAGSVGEPRTESAAMQGRPVAVGKLPKPDFASPPRSMAGLLTDPVEMMQASQPEIEQVCAYVFHSPHVQSNASYRESASRTMLLIDLDDTTVNAYACHKGVGEDRTPSLAILGGACVFARLCSAALQEDAKNRTGALRRSFPFVAKAVLELHGHMTGEKAVEILRQSELDAMFKDEGLYRRVSAYTAGVLAGIVAHELGHLALGHTLGRAANLEVSRNQEREADSFASSVMSASMFGEYLVMGMIVWELAWVWLEGVTGDSVATTHPLARERLYDLVRANDVVAESLGITPKSLESLLP